MQLSHSDFEALQRAICELYEYRTTEDFREAMPGILLKIIPADHFSLACYQINPVTGAAKLVDYVESEKRFNDCFVYLAETNVLSHPFTGYFMAGGKMTALKLSDFFTTQQLGCTVWWETIVENLRFARVMSLPVPSRLGTAALSFGRRSRDFTERDRLVMNLLQPHFNQAQQNAERATAARLARARPLAAYSLTPREAEIAHWLACGKSNPEIASILGISPRTVEKHMEKILDKLGVENRSAAAVMIANAPAARTT